MEMNRVISLSGRRLAALVCILLGGISTSVFAQALSPSTVEVSLRPGESNDIGKTVVTPVIPPRPDICFLADTTGSMGGTILNVRTNAMTIMNMVRAAQPDSQFCAANYKDATDSVPFEVDQQVTDNLAAVQSAINTWVATGGGDAPEGQLHALTRLSTEASFRADSTRIIVWFGDAPGHDPSVGGETLASTILALQAADIAVIAVPVSGGSGLNATGQAAAITTATGGVLISTVDPGLVTAAILAGLTNLPVNVSMQSNCSVVTTGAISTTFDPASQVVTSGSNALFTETILAAAGAVQGQTYLCEDIALLNGTPMRDVTGAIVLETKTVHVLDVTAPSAACSEGANPAGNVPKSKNEDGFFQLNASDNVGLDLVQVCDSASSFCSDPFAAGDTVKITQTPGGTPRDERPGPGGITSHLFLKGDGILSVTDTSGLETRVSCLVPPPPK
jgi:hypothetical protein